MRKSKSNRISNIYLPILISPKETVRELLEYRGVNDKEIEERLNSFQKIDNKRALEFAEEFKLPKSFFLNLQTNYDHELERYNYLNHIIKQHKLRLGKGKRKKIPHRNKLPLKMI